MNNTNYFSPFYHTFYTHFFLKILNLMNLNFFWQQIFSDVEILQIIFFSFARIFQIILKYIV